MCASLQFTYTVCSGMAILVTMYKVCCETCLRWSLCYVATSLNSQPLCHILLQKGQKYGKGLPCGALGCGKNHPHVLRIKPSTQWFAIRSMKFDQMKV